MKNIIYLIVILFSISNCYSQTAETYFDRGVDKANLKDYRGAIADFTKAIELEANYAKTYFVRGRAKTNLQDYRGAIADYMECLPLL